MYQARYMLSRRNVPRLNLYVCAVSIGNYELHVAVVGCGRACTQFCN